jgi:hypothetical protein
MKKVPLGQMVSFANLMKKEVYKMGEVIIGAGHTPQKFSIIANGRASLVYEKKIYRNKNPDNA